MTAKQWEGWQAYFSIRGPFGELRADYRAAAVRKTLADLQRPEGHPGYDMEAFLLKFVEQEEEEYIIGGEKKLLQREQVNEAIVRLICETYKVDQKDIE